MGPLAGLLSYSGLMEVRRVWILGLLAVGVVTAGCGSAKPEPVAESMSTGAEGTSTVRSEGISLELPASWYGDAERPEGPSAPMLRAATFPLVEPLADVGQQAQGNLAEDDILISILDYGPMTDSGQLPSSGPVAVDRSHIASFEGFREPVVTRTITLGGHSLQLWVVFGSSDPSGEQYRQANRVLATLEVAANP